MVVIGPHRVFGKTVCPSFLYIPPVLSLFGVAFMRGEFISVGVPLATSHSSNYDTVTSQ